MLQERKQQKRLEAMQMLSTLSPGGKVQWVTMDSRPLGPDDISNPFIEKSDYKNHQKKIAEIDT